MEKLNTSATFLSSLGITTEKKPIVFDEGAIVDNLWDNITYLLLINKKQRAWLAEQIEISAQSLNTFKYLKSKGFNISIALKIAKVFDIPLEDLFYKNLRQTDTSEVSPKVELKRGVKNCDKLSEKQLKTVLDHLLGLLDIQ